MLRPWILLLLPLPALWLHNVTALEPCISINVFWRHLAPEMYDRKDLYGNHVRGRVLYSYLFHP